MAKSIRIKLSDLLIPPDSYCKCSKLILKPFIFASPAVSICTGKFDIKEHGISSTEIMCVYRTSLEINSSCFSTQRSLTGHSDFRTKSARWGTGGNFEHERSLFILQRINVMLAKYADSPNRMVRKHLARTRQVSKRTASLHTSTVPV